MDIHRISDESKRNLLSLRFYDHHAIINVRKPIGFSKKSMLWALRKVARFSKNHDGNSLGSQKSMSFGHQKQMSGNPLGSHKNHEFWAPKYISGNSLGSQSI